MGQYHVIKQEDRKFRADQFEKLWTAIFQMLLKT